MPKKKELQPQPENKLIKGRYKFFDREDLKKNIVAALRIGANIKTAAEYGGMTYNVLMLWLKRGRDALSKIIAEQETGADDTAYMDFYIECAMAHAQVKIEMLSSIRNQARSGDWRAAKALLDMLDPEVYEHSTSVEVNVNVINKGIRKGMTEEEAMEAYRAYIKRPPRILESE